MGAISVLFLQAGQIETVLLVAVVLTGMSAGSLVPLSAFLPAYFGFATCSLSPLAYVLLGHDSGVLVFIGYLVLPPVMIYGNHYMPWIFTFGR